MTTLISTAFDRALTTLFRGDEHILDPDLRAFAIDSDNAKPRLLDGILKKIGRAHV